MFWPLPKPRQVLITQQADSAETAKLQQSLGHQAYCIGLNAAVQEYQPWMFGLPGTRTTL